MKKTNLILLAVTLFINVLTANAQFNKPLSTRFTKSKSTDALWNLGITGGAHLTQWYHFGGTNTKYDMPVGKSLGYMGGLSLERMINARMSVSLEAMYFMRNIEFSYEMKDFPVALNAWNDITKRVHASYNEVVVQVPYTYYVGIPATSIITPYVFAAPRVSVPLNGKMIWDKEYRAQGDLIDTESDTVAFNKNNYAPFNIGLVAGVGVLCRVNFSTYYLLLKLDASYHAGFINTFSKAERDGTVPEEDVIGSSYIEPTLLGRRFSGDANLKLTILFPLKKQLKGACNNWGEYD